MMQKYIYKIQKIINKILYPQFLKKIERDFLLRRPRLWVMKLHYICYYALLINILIFCIVIIFPMRIYQISLLWTIGFVVFPIVEVILFLYWWYRQSLYNLEKQYGNISKKHVFLEIFGYSACIVLIASATIVFDLSIKIKTSFIIPQTTLSIDILIMDLIDIDRFEKMGEKDKNESITIDSHVSKLKTDIEKKEAQQQKNKSDCNSKFYKGSIDSKLLRLLTSTRINTCENMLFLQNEKINENTQVVLDDLLKNKESKSIKNSIDSIIISIKNGESKEILCKINQYTGRDISGKKEQINLKTLEDAYNKASNTYIVIYKDSHLKLFFIYNYFVCSLMLLLIFLFKNTYFIDFILGLIYLFIIIVFMFTSIVLIFSSSLFSVLNQEKLIILVISPILFVFYQVLAARKVKKYSRFKTINLIIFPFAVFISAHAVVLILDARHLIVYDTRHFVITSFIGSLLYLPFIPYLKTELIRQLSLPKD